MRTAFAVAICVAIVGCSKEIARIRPSDRSWTNGTISVVPTQTGGELGVTVRGEWPNCQDDLWIRYELYLVQSSAPDAFLVGSSNKLTAFQKGGAGVSDYCRASSFVGSFDLTKPYMAVFDYEIWRGEPTKGELLTKNSVASSAIAPRPTQ